MSLERLGVGTYKTTCAADTEYFGCLLYTSHVRGTPGHRNGGRRPPVSGQSMGGTPGPVPNPEAKPHRAESTAGSARGRPGRR